MPITFLKPKRGKDSCQSVYFVKNDGVAVCLRASHITDFTSDETNGVLVVDDELNDSSKKWGGTIVEECNTIDANYWKGITNNQGRCGVLVVDDEEADSCDYMETDKG